MFKDRINDIVVDFISNKKIDYSGITDIYIYDSDNTIAIEYNDHDTQYYETNNNRLLALAIASKLAGEF